MKRIAVVTRNEFLYKKIALAIDNADTVMTDSPEDALSFDRIFVDLDTCPYSIDGAVTMSRSEACDLKIPFSIDAPGRYLSHTAEARLLQDRRAVLIDGVEIKLTELEYSLFTLLAKAGGKPVSRDEILDRVWNGDADGGVVNVYIHYLREKLETGGERVIVVSRGKGYSLTEKYAKMFERRGAV